MFRAAYRSSSAALTVFAASGLHTHVVSGRSQVWVSQFPLRLDYGRSTHAYVNHRLQIQLELLLMSGMLLETCWALNERWNNKFYYKLASCWLFLLSHTTMHGSMNIKLLSFLFFILSPIFTSHSYITPLLSFFLPRHYSFFIYISYYGCNSNSCRGRTTFKI